MADIIRIVLILNWLARLFACLDKCTSALRTRGVRWNFLVLLILYSRVLFRSISTSWSIYTYDSTPVLPSCCSVVPLFRFTSGFWLASCIAASLAFGALSLARARHPLIACIFGCLWLKLTDTGILKNTHVLHVWTRPTEMMWFVSISKLARDPRSISSQHL